MYYKNNSYAIKNSDKQNARIELDNTLRRVKVELLNDHGELFRQFSDQSGADATWIDLYI